MEGRAVAYEPLSSNFDWKKIQEELQEMGESINCDVEFEEVYELWCVLCEGWYFQHSVNDGQDENGIQQHSDLQNLLPLT